MPEQRVTNLPPAGHERREELARRKDALEEQAETQYADVEAFDPSVLEPDREIRDSITKNFLEVGQNHPTLAVKWVNYVHNHGSAVWHEKALGWKVASSQDFPEAGDMKREDGSIRIGDVLLMCITKDRHLKLEMQKRDKERRKLLGIESDINAITRKHRGVFSEVQSTEIGNIDPATAGKIQRRALATNAAKRMLGERMKEGEIPGLPIK